jgi:hypothetical protein
VQGLLLLPASAWRSVIKKVRENARRPAVMIGCPLSSDRFNPGPEVVLWRWVVLVLGQVLACLAY